MMLAILLPLSALTGAAEVEAQILGRGTVSVAVVDRDGFSLQGVLVRIARAEDDAMAREISTSSTGVANFFYLDVATYDVEVERLGYVPVRIRGIQVLAGEHDRLRVQLREMPPPITEFDEFFHADVGAPRLAAGARLLAGDPRRFPLGPLDAGRLLQWGSAAGQVPLSLPLRFLEPDLEGFPVRGAWSAAGGPGADLLHAFPFPFLGSAVPRLQGPVAMAVEGPGTSLGFQGLTAGSRTEGRVSVGATWTEAGGEGGNEAGAGGGSSSVAPRVSAVVSTPLQGDTLRLISGFAFEPWAAATPSLLAPSSRAGETVGLLQDAGAMNGALGEAPDEARPLVQRNVISGFSRMDWNDGRSLAFTVMAHGTLLPEDPAGLRPPLPEGYLTSTSGSDFVASSRFLWASPTGNAVEVNLGASRSRRVTGTGLGSESEIGGLALLDRGAMVGPQRETSGEFGLTTVSFSPVFALAGQRYGLRSGLFGVLEQWQDQRSAGDERRVLLADGSRAGTLGAGPGNGHGLQRTLRLVSRDVSMRHSTVGAFADAYYWVTPSFRVRLDTRLDGNLLPREELSGNPGWLQATGIVSNATGDDRTLLSGGAELQWEPRTLPGWSATLLGRVRSGTTHPALMGMVIADGGATNSIRTLGSEPRTEGYRFHLLGPNFQPPRGQLLSARIDGRPAAGLRLGIGIFHHRTDFLPRRRDLNLSPGVGIQDQFGRSHVGQLVRRDGLITILPGSDRRFPGFDQVWAVEADGWAESLGVSVGATLESGPLVLEATYTASRTEDNAPFGLTGLSNPVAGFLGSDLRDAAWVEGRSDHDRPHQARVVGLLELPVGVGSRLVGGYQVLSGRPFSAGVRDALGFEWEEGWTRLQPVTLADGVSLPGSGDGWTCSQATSPDGRLERNGCRGEALHLLDLRLELGLPAIGGRPLVLGVDVLNLLDQVDVLRDPALAVVDGTRDFAMENGGARVRLPVAANPTFGEPLARLPGGRSVRLGLEFRF